MHLKCILIKPVTYTVKSFSILEQAAFLLGPIACCRFMKFNCESNRSLTTATVRSTTLRPRVQYTANLKKTKPVSKFNNFKINFNFTLKCSCQSKQSMFQFQQAAGHSWCVQQSQIHHHCNPLTAASESDALSGSFCQSNPDSGLQPLTCEQPPTEELYLALAFHTWECTGLGLWKWVAQTVPVRAACALTHAMNRLLLPDGCGDQYSAAKQGSAQESLFSESVLMCNIYLHMWASVFGNTRLGAVQYISLSQFKTTYCVTIDLESFPAGES